MIRFPCRCGHVLEVPDDLAAGDAQCPACGLLNTVPTLNDAKVGLGDDGTYTFDIDDTEKAQQDRTDRLRSLHRAFTRNTTAADGSEIDNRISIDELALAGEIPLADEKLHERPKYDPITGERIRPLEIKQDDGPSTDEIPMARAAITYAAGTQKPGSIAGVMHLLTSPGNLAVLGVMLIMHLFVLGIMVASATFIFAGVVAILLMIGVIAHFANIIDEVGPRDMDELPRPFRDLAIAEDIFWPLIHMLTSFAIAFWPLGYLARKFDLPPIANLIVVAITLLWAVVTLPALLVTTTTSGTFLNLRPDRVLGVIRAGGPTYIWLCILGVAAVASYGFGFVGVGTWMGKGTGSSPAWTHTSISFPLWTVGIFLMHLFCYQLGLYYREHHNSFNWAYQRHRKLKPEEEMAIRAARRAVRKQERAEREAYRSTSRSMRKW